MDIQTVTKFASLFAGRTDVYFDSDKSFQVKGVVTLETFRKHLNGTKAIGTYPVLDDSRCKWGCIDIDEDNIDIARDIVKVWSYFGITSWLEVSRSKGYHVWIFLKRWESAQLLRAAGRYVEFIATEQNRLEVNPKADAPWLTPNGYVNTVRLPYPGNRKTARNVVYFPNLDVGMPLESFVNRATREATGPSELRAVARRWEQLEQEKRLSSAVTAGEATGRRGAGNARNQDAWHILEGLRQVVKGERDNQLYTVARLMEASSIPFDLALAKMEAIWFNQLEDNGSYPLTQALDKVRRVYGT